MHDVIVISNHVTTPSHAGRIAMLYSVQSPRYQVRIALMSRLFFNYSLPKVLSDSVEHSEEEQVRTFPFSFPIVFLMQVRRSETKYLEDGHKRPARIQQDNPKPFMYAHSLSIFLSNYDMF